MWVALCRNKLSERESSMFQLGWQFVQESYQNYTSYGVIQLLLICSVIVILINDKKKENIHLAIFIVTIIVCILFPPIAFLFGKYFIGGEVYWRIFWLIPSGIIIALVFTKLLEKSKYDKKNIYLISIILVLIIGGKNIFNSNNFTKSTNLYKLPQEVIEICDLLVDEGEETKIVVPETIVSYIRQYNPKINMLYGRNLGKDVQRGKKFKILTQLNSAEPDTKYIAKYAKKQECNYIVFKNSSTGIEKIEEYGYKLYHTTSNYSIFKLEQ